VDLSGVIFVILAVAWAGYLIPRALRHHEEIAASRPVDTFSDTMRVLERTPATMKALLTPPAAKAAPAATSRSAVATRSATKGAARRRRRVLGLLLLATAATAGVAAFHYIPWVSVAIPGVLVVGWLVLCRLMVRKARRRPVSTVVEESPVEAGLETPVAVPTPVAPDPVAALEVDGSLWDPLPLTLPTYVSKPAARRTVRTIDLTQTGVTSSGHKAEDSTLARAAEADAKAASSTDSAPGEDQQRKAAGA
jgi:hypothetical protein